MSAFAQSSVNSNFVSYALERSLNYLGLLIGTILAAIFVFRKRDIAWSTCVVAAIVAALSTTAAIAVLSLLANWMSGIIRLGLFGSAVGVADLLIVFVFVFMLSLAGFLAYAVTRHALKARRGHYQHGQAH